MVDPLFTDWIIRVLSTMIGTAYVAAGLTLRFLTKNDTQQINHPGLTFAFLGIVILIFTHFPVSGTHSMTDVIVRFLVVVGVAWAGIDYYRRVIASRDYLTLKDGIRELSDHDGDHDGRHR